MTEAEVMARGRAAGTSRVLEIVLLLLAAGVAIAATMPLAVEGDGAISWRDLAGTLALVGLFFAIYVALALRARQLDPVLLPAILALTGLNLALSARLAPALSDRQNAWVMVGVLVLAAILAAPFDERRLLRRYRYTWAVAGMALVGLTMIAGRSVTPGGPRLWLGIGGHGFQPSEVLKLLLVVYLAGYLEDKQELLADADTRMGRLRLPPLPYLAPLAVMLGLSLALLAVQRDLGAGLLLFGTAIGMLYMASARLDYVLVAVGLFSGGVYAMHDRIAIVAQRIAIWLDPWSVSQDAGYQLVQSLMAIGAGGITGAGIGLGAPESIPAVHTDFVYAAIVEEIGLAGALAVLALYALLSLRGFRIAVRCPDSFGRMLAGGLTLALTLQVLLIIGGVVKLVPLTGITLPFLSHGGTSLVTSMILVGLLARASEETK